MELLTKANWPKYEAWVARALQDDGVWPWLNTGRFWEPRKEPLDGDWSGMDFVSKDTLATIRFDRDKLTAQVAMWTCGDSHADRALASAAGLSAIAGALERHKWLRYVGTVCAVTNIPSWLLNNKIFGRPWGIEPGAAWDAASGSFVSLAHFSAPYGTTEEWHERIIAATRISNSGDASAPGKAD